SGWRARSTQLSIAPLVMAAWHPHGSSCLRLGSCRRHALAGDNWGWASEEIPVFDSTESGRVGKKFSGMSRRRAIEETAESAKGPELGGARFDGPQARRTKM